MAGCKVCTGFSNANHETSLEHAALCSPACRHGAGTVPAVRYALDFARGNTKATIEPDRCTLLQDGASRYIVSGSGSSWIGLRPPEGVDYQTFSMIRW